MPKNKAHPLLAPSDGDSDFAIANDRARGDGAEGEMEKSPSDVGIAPAGGTVRKGLVSLIDQGVVSATNFLTMVMVGRTTEHELGVYQLGLSVVMLATGVQMALISMPYAVFGNRMERYVRATYAGSMLIHQSLLALVASILVAVSGVGIMLWAGLVGTGVDSSSLAAELPFIWVLAATLPFILLREFIRRIAFAHLQVVTVLLMDVATSIVQLSGLLLLSHFGGLSAGTGFIMVGATCAVTGIGVLILIRRDFTPKPAKALVDLRQNWSFGKWAFAAQLAYLGIVYSVPWILALLHDPHTTGEFAACTSLVMIANPILLGLSNFLYPQAIRIFDSGGLVALRRLTFQATFTTIAIVSPLVILLIAFGGQLVASMYGPSYTGLQNIMTVLSANIVLFALNMGVENGLMTLRRPKSVFLSNSAGLVLTAAFGLALIYTYSVMGAAIVTLIGQVTTLVCKGYVFLSVTEEMAPAQNDLVMEVS